MAKRPINAIRFAGSLIAAALVVAPTSSGSMQTLTWLLPGVRADNPGVGWYDPEDPTNSCIGGAGLTAGAPPLFYSFSRIGSNAGFTQMVPGTGSVVPAPISCPGPTFPLPDNYLGIEDTMLKAGTFVYAEARLGPSQFPVLDGSQSWLLNECPPADAVTTPGASGGASAVDCNSGFGMLFNGTFLMTEGSAGSWHMGADRPFLHEEQVGTGHVVVQSCLTVTVSTLLGVETLAQDQDHFFAFDGAAFGGSSDQEAIEWAFDPAHISDGSTDTPC